MIVEGDVHFAVDVRFPDSPEIEIVGTADGLRKLAEHISALAEDMTSGQPEADIGEHFHWFGQLGGDSADSITANFRKIDRPSTGLPCPDYLASMVDANAGFRQILAPHCETDNESS